MKGHADRDAGLTRIKKLERRLAVSPAKSRQRRELMQTIRIEAALYRRSLDADQAARTRDPRPRALR